MYNVLEFLDSPDIREFHKDTVFTPAEQAVLIAKSNCRTVTDKIAALEQIAEHTEENEYGTENVQSDYMWDETSFKDALAATVQVWKGALQDRWDSEGCVFAETLIEKECVRYNFSDYHLYSTYQKAYDALVMRKQEYTEDEDLNEVETFGIIERIRLDRDRGCEDEYRFNNEMQLIRVFADDEKARHLEDICLLNDYDIYIPLPFQKGDIVKVKPVYGSAYYGVVPADFEK